ncbi:Maf-like protein [Chelativorans salis]|uniref:7-methyl-GTP pyrophosphatase n=1 Tax=Chelativorans salis TaxID=2978478 RepID=A0ABT2LRJ1_9HYPH|nr:Maf-like protein [Chelativorans sp. EGI FJ00035]MCT7376243.1 Maf-like protein [Chelativorans sp. EGI FJ00035]
MPNQNPTIVLASTSPFRRQLLENAGLAVNPVAPEVDERALEAPLEGSGASAEDVALILAEAKAVDVSERYPEEWVVGGDQTLSLEDRMFHKPQDMGGARRHLLALSGRTHQLNSAVVLSRGGGVVWRHVAVARMTMRPLDPGFIGRYLSRVGDKALSSVGAYQVEGEGIQLFEKIEGDYFTIVGVPLLPLLAKLREIGAIDG